MKKITFFIIVLSFTGLCFQVYSQATDIDSLINLADQAKGKEKIMLLSDISYYSSFNNVSLSIEYGNKCLSEAQAIGDSLLIAEAYNALAIAYYARSDYEESLEYNKKALKIRLNYGDAYSIMSSYSKIGNCLSDMGKFDEAISYYLKCLKICEDNKLTRQIGLIANNIAEVLRSQKNYQKAKKYYSIAIETANSLHDTIGWANAMINLGVMNMHQKNYGDADSLYSKAYSMIKGKKFLDIEAGIYINFGVLYKEQGKLKEGIAYYQKAKNIYEKTGEIHGMAIVYSNLGNSFLEKGYNDSAFVYYNKGIELARETKSLTRLQYAYESMSNYYQANKDYRQAFRYDSIADNLRDSVFTTEKSKIIEELNTKYETEKKEKQLAEQKNTLTRQKLEVQRKNSLLAGTSGGLVTLLIIGFFIYREQKNRQEKLRHQVALEKAETVARIQQEKLRISRDLHDNIGSQLTFVVSSLDNLKYIQAEQDRTNKLKQLSSFTRETMVQLRETIWILNAETISYDQLVSRIAEFINQAKAASPETNFTINSGHDDPDFNANQAINIYRTVQEAVNNAIKHAGAEHVILEAITEKLSVTDNGKGFNKNIVAEGNGLKNMKLRMKESGFRTEIISTPGKGTSVTIWLS